MKKILSVLAMFFAFTTMAFAAVNLNTATKEQLDAVKGIGPAKAQAIIDYRAEHGPFTSVNDLKNVKGFGDKTVAKMRSELTVSGGNTAPAAKEEKKADKAAKAGGQSEKAAKAGTAGKPEAKTEEVKDAKADKKADKKARKAAAKAAKKEAKKAASADTADKK